MRKDCDSRTKQIRIPGGLHSDIFNLTLFPNIELSMSEELYDADTPSNIAAVSEAKYWKFVDTCKKTPTILLILTAGLLVLLATKIDFGSIFQKKLYSSETFKALLENSATIQEVMNSSNPQSGKQQTKIPVIYARTGFFSGKFTSMWISSHKLHCPELECIYTESKKWFSKADAILIHNRDMNWRSSEIPGRKPFQRYVFFLKESPYHSGKIAPYYPGYFNWTSTYRRDSDVSAFYGKFVRIESNETQRKSDWKDLALVLKRKKLVVWFASNCHTPSNRGAYVRALKKHIAVDMYGACGNLVCSKSEPIKCRKLIRDNYMFYLSFENSICTDYVTEKFFDRFKDLVVPIVLNREIHEKVAPKDSFIAADDFESPYEGLNTYYVIIPTKFAKYIPCPGEAWAGEVVRSGKWP